MGYSQEECYTALQEAAKRLGKSPSKSEYDELELRPCANEIHRICDSWNSAKEEVGLEVHQRASTYSDQDCIDALHKAAEKLGKSPSRADYDNLDILPGTTTISRRFGGWAAAKRTAGLEVLSPGTEREYTKQECIEALQEAAEQLGHSPYMDEYDDLDIHPKSSTITKYFDGWNTAKREAGLETYNYSEQDCLNAIQEAADHLGHSPTQQEYRDLGLKPSINVFQQKFGEWVNAKAEIGLNSRGSVTCSEQECLEALKEAHERLGHSPTTREYERLDIRPSIHEIKTVFGSWNNAKEEIGYETVPSSHEITYSKEDCIDGLKQASEQLGVSPTMREYSSLGIRPSGKVIKRRFESWNEAKDAAGLEKYSDGTRSDGHYYGPEWGMRRDQVLQRDEYQCQNCGIMVESHIDEYRRSLHVHHIIPFGEFNSHKVANHMSNLVALCQRCHKSMEAEPFERQCDILEIPSPAVEPGNIEGQQRLEHYTSNPK